MLKASCLALKNRWWFIVVLLMAMPSAFAANKPKATNYSTVPVEKLIDGLTALKTQTVGIHGTAWASGFMATDEEPRFGGGILGSYAPQTLPQMRELVRRGITVLPYLIQHLNDKRLTKLAAGHEFMFRYFSDEYDPRNRNRRTMPPKKKPLERNFDGDYTIKVGDVCYVLIGQIVNRNLAVLRYQPTLGLVVNSPIESPVLAQFVKTDWSGLTTDVHKTSLIADMRSGNDLWEFGPASERLRFYYPASYQYLRQNLYKKKILEFEKDEKANQTPKKASSRRAKKKKRQIKRT